MCTCVRESVFGCYGWVYGVDGRGGGQSHHITSAHIHTHSRGRSTAKSRFDFGTSSRSRCEYIYMYASHQTFPAAREEWCSKKEESSIIVLSFAQPLWAVRPVHHPLSLQWYPQLLFFFFLVSYMKGIVVYRQRAADGGVYKLRGRTPTLHVRGKEDAPGRSCDDKLAP
jgi:hypothetical protein